MTKALPNVIADILTYYGAVVENTENNSCLDVVLPPDVFRTLNIPEYARLIFSYNEIYDNTIYASYDSEFFNLIKNLFDTDKRLSVVKFESSIPNMEKILEKFSRVATKKIDFLNATFRLDRSEFKDISYLLLYFKYVALSDEKHEGIMPVLINEMTLSTLLLEEGITDLEMFQYLCHSNHENFENDYKNNPPSPPPTKGGMGGFSGERYDIKDVFHAGYTACTNMVKEKLKDFNRSLERRLNRDIKRVYEYYDTLKSEAKIAIEKKGDDIDKLPDKIEVIELERKGKIHDLISKYTLNIQAIPVCAIRIETQSPVFWINIKRRLNSRQFPITYNLLIKQFDALPCESCYTSHPSYYICDDKLHIICSNCFLTCPECKKQYCKACNNTCPRCK